MADVKWIKIAVDMFDNRKIKQIGSMPEGDSLLLMWVQLLCLAGNVNDGGFIYLTKEIPYTDEMLATQFNKPILLTSHPLQGDLPTIFSCPPLPLPVCRLYAPAVQSLLCHRS